MTTDPVCTPVCGLVSRSRFSTLAGVFLLALSLPFSGHGQSERPLQDLAAARSASQAAARDLFEAGQHSEAVAMLSSTNARPTGTAGWHCETAAKLLQMAWRFSSEGKTELADRVALLAIGQTEDALNNAGERENELAADALLTAALIQERFFGDFEAAKESCRLAATLAPNNESSRQTLDRLERAERQSVARDSGN
jgi:hypothetical protein